MQNINHLNLKIQGVNYIKLMSLEITHKVNDHGYAELNLEVDPSEAARFVDCANENTTITITTSAEGQHSVLFCGGVISAGLNYMSQYTCLKIKLVSASHKLDIKKVSQTFQNTGSTYEDILNKVCAGRAVMDIAVTDRPIGNMKLQNKETDWQFIMRMASELSASVFTTVHTQKPQILVGVPSLGTVTLPNTVESKQGLDLEEYSKFAQNSNGLADSTSFGAESIQSEKYCYIGEKINVNGGSSVISSVSCNMQKGILKCSYNLLKESGFERAEVNNSSTGGKMFMGTVQAVKGDKVQVFFHEIDGSYDEGGTQWFPYSTSYSSSDGSGFYCMPEVGDQVRVFMPSNNEKDAFVASSVNLNPQSNTRDKSWKAPGGKEILLTDDGIYIICDEEKIFINLTTEKGIEITSEKDIEITSDANITLKAGKKIEMKAENAISMEVGNSNIQMDSQQIVLGADKVFVN